MPWPGHVDRLLVHVLLPWSHEWSSTITISAQPKSLRRRREPRTGRDQQNNRQRAARVQRGPRGYLELDRGLTISCSAADDVLPSGGTTT
jgi:hypothetical protein